MKGINLRYLFFLKVIFFGLFGIVYLPFSGCQTIETKLTLEEKAAQMVMIGFRGTSLQEQPQIIYDIQTIKIGGVVLFEYDLPSQSRPRNISSPQQLQQLCHDLQQLSPHPLLIAIDQEGGKVNRLKEQYGFPKTVSQGYLGMLNNNDSTKKYAAATARQLQQMGFNLNFAPCTDVNINPDCPVIGKIERSFSSDPAIVAQHAAIVVAEHHREGILTCFKHFPGHGSASTDSHLGFTDISKTWQPAELIPYQQMINNGLCDAIMTGHVFISDKDSLYPSTLSKNIIQKLLRDSLGWEGVVFSDDMMMEAISANFNFDESIVLAINAGVDILIFGNNSPKGYDANIAEKVVNSIVKSVKEQKISEQRIDEAYQRIQQLKLHCK
ncbi:MAG: glycoside hydrolase family 3 protein [Bacteroidales bacterium]|nr:glycoside hydrolase family 3 protein [Bacteroidales bacterium]